MALTDNLISVWHMNNDWQDSIGTNHGTAYGATFSASAKLGSHAGSFDGIDDSVEFKTSEIISKLANHSMSCWVYVTSLDDDNTLYQESATGANNRWYCRVTTSGWVSFSIRSAGADVTLNAAAGITINNWYHIVITFGSGGMKIFVNGIYKANNATNTTPVTETVNKSSFGRLFPNLIWPLIGRSDELNLWGKTLTDGGVSVGQTATGEVAELYNGGAGIELGAAASVGQIMHGKTLKSLTMGRLVI